MEPRIVLFVLRADPKGIERLGAYLSDGSVIDLQAAHMSMRGRPAAALRDRTAYRLAHAEAIALAREIIRWVDTERAPGTAIAADLVRVIDDRPESGAPPTGRRAPP